jgi:hypothetical protein
MVPVLVRSAAVLLLASAAMSGCSTPSPDERESSSAAEVRTGSNIPRKSRSGDKVQTLDSDSVQQPLSPPSRPPTGAGGG